jgi:hypothetical protein
MIPIKNLKPFLDLSDRESALFLLSPYSFEDIKNQEVEGVILNFAKELKSYLLDLCELNNKIIASSISQENAERILGKINNEIIEAGANTTNKTNSKIISKNIKDKFRFLAGVFAYKSDFVKRAFDKPRGYPGDYKTIEFVYDNQTVSEGIGKYFDKYFLSNEYAVAVRNRKDKMKGMLAEFIQSSEQSTISILNLACGSCREIKELLQNNNFPDKKITFTLVDQDEEALRFSEKILLDLPANIQFKLFRENLYDFIKDNVAIKKYSEKLACHDLIYTIGLSDYLPDRALGNLTKFCFDLLFPEGKLILAHKDINMYMPLMADWFCDWTFYPRTQQSLVNLARSFVDIQDKNISLDNEKSGIIFFLTLGKT